MNLKKILPKKQFLKKCVVFSIFFSLLTSSFALPFQTPISPESVYAVGNSCNTTFSNGNTSVKLLANHKGRVGGVALDQAAKFLANMSDISSAYYDAGLDRIVFVGKTTTSAPQFDKDDLAVVIKSIIFDHQMPWVSIEGTNPDPNLIDAVYSTGIENTRLGNILIQADYKLKSYVIGTDENGQEFHSSVSGYASHPDRYYSSLGINPDIESGNRFWLTPKEITLAKDDAASSFVFQTATMQLKTEALSTNNDPIWNSTAQDFANQFTQSYDAYAQESPILNDAKELAKIAGVIKWISDSGVVTDFQWARDYSPKAVQTPTTFNKRLGKIYETETGFYQTSGGADLLTPNSYTQDNGTSSSLKGAAQAVPTTKEDIHWTFTKDSQQYEAVAVTADAFRTLGSYNTSEIDMSFPTVGDLTLAFQRTYSSYSGGQYGAGIGWNIYPAALYDNDPVHTFSCSGSAYPKALAFSSSRTGFESFKISDCAVGYVADDPVFHSKVFRNGDGSFTAKIKDQTEYSFSSTYQLTKIKDKNSNTITYSYDGSGKLTSIMDGKGHQITPNYGGNGLISSITDWSGRIVQYTYDANGNLLTVKDPNNGVITYAYDSNSKLTTVTDRTNQPVVTNTYTDEAKLATQKDAANITNTFTYDKVNRIITATNNQTPNRTQITKYDTKARILEQTDPLLFKLIYTYGTEYAPLTVKDKNNNTTTYIYDTNGNLLTVTYPDAKKVAYQYDTSNRLTKITDERYGTPGKDTTNTYDTIGNLSQINEAGLITKFTYDPSGEAITLTDSLNHVITWTRDAFGNKLTEKDALLKTANFEYDTVGKLKKKTDADNKITTFAYDNNGNILSLNDGTGTTTNVYDKENRLQKITLPDNTTTEFTYNAAGSLATTKDLASNISSYGYDAYQNLTIQTDALSKITINTYDVLNRQTQSTTPLGKLYKYEYDGSGNITKRTDANNNVTTYLYSAFNQLTKITYPNASTVTFTYDNRGNRTQMVDSVGTSTYVYDNFDRLTKATNAYGKVLQYTYDNANNLKTITYPNSGTITYAYDNNNRLVKVTDWDNKVTAYTYNNNGTLATRQLPNTIKTTYLYDSANRLKTVTHAKSTTTLAKYNYTRDLVGNITIATESGSFIGTAQTIKYNYDALGRITKATYPSSKTFEYAYDKMGNRLTQKKNGTNTTTYTYDNDYKLTQKNTYTNYSYDNNGNQTKKPSENFNPDPTYNYDFENRLTKHVTSVGNVYNYTYDGLGNRLRKVMSTAATRYIYDINGPLSRLMATSGDQNYAFDFWIYGLGLIYDSGNNYYLEDGSGNVRFTADSSGYKSTSANYDPFGNLRSSSGLPDGFLFNKQLLDDESNLYFLRARYYDPDLGRFISRDPVKGDLIQPQTQNPYSYSLNNPINLSDPSGEQVLQKCLQYAPQVIGKLGEVGAQIIKNKERIPSLTNSANYRIPDQLLKTEKILSEVKNVSYQALTNQIKDFVEFANTKNYTFELITRPTTIISGPLQNLIDSNQIIQKFLP